MNKCEFSTPSVVLIGIGVLFLLWLIGKLLGASFFFLAAVVIVFLIVLIAYLVMRLHDEPLLRRIKHCFGIAEPEKEEEN
jgi:peptidoglycan/LPS O-acetylase OafA/YrhL